MANKQDVINHAAEVTGLRKKDVEAVLDAEHRFITEKLVAGETVKVHGFVNYDVTEAGERQGNNPQNGEPMTIKSYKTLRAKPTERLKDVLNGRRSIDE